MPAAPSVPPTPARAEPLGTPSPVDARGVPPSVAENVKRGRIAVVGQF